MFVLPNRTVVSGNPWCFGEKPTGDGQRIVTKKCLAESFPATAKKLMSSETKSADMGALCVVQRKQGITAAPSLLH
ncbi:hypothetical protein EYF80_027510 [Liparis tanakae]|uniref:Uncharacterized protein n=1 Tax=Liparis tanakae TaxID=230148 RepID=A0A4Z2H8Y6_9TELE|nr:hypothetical protein EYF80_027510 [Liparis tanakae]